MRTIRFEQKIFGSLVHIQGDTVLAYTDAVSHQADAIGMMLNGMDGITLPKEYATLLFMFNPENQRYTFIHYQGAHVEFPQNARYYTTRCIYEINKEDMESLDYLYSNIIKALPRMKRQEDLNINTFLEINVEQQLPYAYNHLSHEERTIYRHILASIATNTQLWIQLDNQYSDYQENGVFHSPKLNAILKAIDTLPRELRTYASLAFSTNGAPQILIDQSLIVAYHANPDIFIDNIHGIHLDWSNEALVSPSSPSIAELKHVIQIAPLVPILIKNAAPYRANVFKLIPLIKKNIDKIIDMDVNELTNNNISLCAIISKENKSIYRYEEIVEKLSDCIINDKKEVSIEEFRVFVDQHPHLQRKTKIIQYLTREMMQQKEQQTIPTLHTPVFAEEPDIPVLDEELATKIKHGNKPDPNRFSSGGKFSFTSILSKNKWIIMVSIILLLAILASILYFLNPTNSHDDIHLIEPKQSDTTTVAPLYEDSIVLDTILSDTIHHETDFLSAPMTDSTNISLPTQNQEL